MATVRHSIDLNEGEGEILNSVKKKYRQTSLTAAVKCLLRLFYHFDSKEREGYRIVLKKDNAPDVELIIL